MQPLKRKIIEEYNKLIQSLFVGKSFDYDYILDMITFIEMGSATNNPELIQNYYLNKRLIPYHTLLLFRYLYYMLIK